MNSFPSRPFNLIVAVVLRIFPLWASCHAADGVPSPAQTPGFPDANGVYALDGSVFTPLYVDFLGGSREEQKKRLTFTPNVSILIFQKGIVIPPPGKESIGILDWRTLGEKPMTYIFAKVAPVGNRTDMITIVPKQPLKAGLYSVGTGDGKKDYLFGIETPSVEEYWRGVLEEKPRSWQAHNQLGAALYIRGDTGEAASHFARAVELNPDNPESHNNLGLTLSLSGKMDEAIQQFEMAVKLKDDSAIDCNLANAYEQVKRYDDAIRTYNHSIQINPGNASAHCNLGYALMQESKLDDAIAEFRKAIEIDPNMSQGKDDLDKALKMKASKP
jgi:Tfp pilus assembly protein PilF